MTERLPWFRCFPSALLGALSGMPPDEGLVYVTVLLRIYETGGPVHESGRTLARRTGLTERRAKGALDGLIVSGKVTSLGDNLLDSPSTHGEIEWQTARQKDQSSAGKASAAKRQNQASVEKNATSGLSDDPNDAEKCKQNQRNEANGRSTGDERASNHLDKDRDTDHSEDKPLSVTRTSDFPPNAFERWYGEFPNKVGKQAAERAFDKVRRSGNVSFAELVAGLRRYRATKPANREWCNPATWLNQGRWADQPAVVPLPLARASPPARENKTSHGALSLLNRFREASDVPSQSNGYDHNGPVIDHEGNGRPRGQVLEQVGGQAGGFPPQAVVEFARTRWG